jgi:hypothetical protein
MLKYLIWCGSPGGGDGGLSGLHAEIEAFCRYVEPDANEQVLLPPFSIRYI